MPALPRIPRLALLLGGALMLLACGPQEAGPAGNGTPVAMAPGAPSGAGGRAARIAAKQCVINIGSDPSSLDPSQATDEPAHRALQFLIRGLTVQDANGKAKPELAESWTVSADGLHWKFKLREAYWSNGERVTAKDFVYTWTRRALNPKFASQYAYMLYYIKGAKAYYDDPSRGVDSIGVRAPAPDTLEVDLEGPTPFFLQLLAHQTYCPVCASVDQANPNWYRKAETYVGDGPFTLKDYQPGYQIVVEKNPKYWNAAAVKMNEATLRMIEQESTERIAYDNGEIDGTSTVPRQDLDELKTRPDFRKTPLLAAYFVVLNCRKPPLDDARVRRALALAVNRRDIVEGLTRDGEEIALTLSPPELYDGKLPETSLKDNDGEDARKLLAEAGYPGGKDFPTLRYLYNTMEGHKRIGLVLQDAWKRELGIDVTLENQEFKVMIDRRRVGDFDIARNGWVADFADPMNFLELFDSSSENNDGKWFDKKYDALLAAIRAEPDETKRLDQMRTAESYLMDNAPLIPLYFYTQPYLVAPGFEGYRLNVMGLFDPVDFAWSDAAGGK